MHKRIQPKLDLHSENTDITDKVRMYEEIMRNDDNLESNY